MASRPSTYLNWLAGLASPPAAYLSQPPSGQRTTGWVSGQPGPFQYENYIIWLLDQWIQYLDGNSVLPQSVTVTVNVTDVYSVLPPIVSVFALGNSGTIKLPDSTTNANYRVTIKNINFSNPSFVVGVGLATVTDKIEAGTAGAAIPGGLTLGQSVTLQSDGTGNYWMVSP